MIWISAVFRNWRGHLNKYDYEDEKNMKQFYKVCLQRQESWNYRALESINFLNLNILNLLQ